MKNKLTIDIKENTEVIEQCTKDILKQTQEHTEVVVNAIFNKIRANIDSQSVDASNSELVNIGYVQEQLEAWSNGWQSYLEEDSACIESLEIIEESCDLIDSELNEIVEEIEDELEEANESISGMLGLAVELNRYYSDSISKNRNFVEFLSDCESISELPTDIKEIR